jgi:uncharacterized protein with FMN-binding domain
VRRAFVTLGGLVVGTTLLVSLKSAPGAGRLPGQVAADAAAASATPTPTPSHTPNLPAVPTPQVSRSAAPSATPAPGPRTATRPPAPPPPAATSTGPPTVTLGDSAVTEFGYVTVGITVAGGRITDVILDEMPGDEPRSISISAKAGPVLRQRALAAQSAAFDSVSGATWTSDAFKVSLRSAMAKAGLGA